MDLETLYNDIKTYALNTQGVESFTIGDCYVNWNSLHMSYGAFNVALNYIQYQDNVMEYHMTLYYGDKLKNDSSNVYQVQDTGFKAVRNVLRHLEDEYGLDGIEFLQIYPFWQRFADVLAGCYADVVIYAPIDDNCENYDKPEPTPEPDDNNDEENNG